MLDKDLGVSYFNRPSPSGCFANPCLHLFQIHLLIFFTLTPDLLLSRLLCLPELHSTVRSSDMTSVSYSVHSALQYLFILFILPTYSSSKSHSESCFSFKGQLFYLTMNSSFADGIPPPYSHLCIFYQSYGC